MIIHINELTERNLYNAFSMLKFIPQKNDCNLIMDIFQGENLLENIAQIKSGGNKETILRPQYVLKFGNFDAVLDDYEKIKNFHIKYNLLLDPFISSFILYSDKASIKPKYNHNTIHYFDCIILQPRVQLLNPPYDGIYVTSEWEKNAKIYYGENEISQLLSSLTEDNFNVLDVNPSNIGYYQNNRPIIFDW